MTAAVCPVCTGRVPTINGNLITHRHRDQLGPCPGGQVEPEGADVDMADRARRSEAELRTLATLLPRIPFHLAPESMTVVVAWAASEIDRLRARIIVRDQRIDRLQRERDDLLTKLALVEAAVVEMKPEAAPVDPDAQAERTVASTEPGRWEPSDPPPISVGATRICITTLPGKARCEKQRWNGTVWERVEDLGWAQASTDGGKTWAPDPPDHPRRAVDPDEIDRESIREVARRYARPAPPPAP